VSTISIGLLALIAVALAWMSGTLVDICDKKTTSAAVCFLAGSLLFLIFTIVAAAVS
jgi:hypothetical protein